MRNYVSQCRRGDQSVANSIIERSLNSNRNERRVSDEEELAAPLRSRWSSLRSHGLLETGADLRRVSTTGVLLSCFVTSAGWGGPLNRTRPGNVSGE